MVKFGSFSKYRNKRVMLDGHNFHSQMEAERYELLKICERTGAITNLSLQPEFELHCANGDVICKYIADFMYRRKDEIIVEDVKGFETDTYRLKRKWFLAEYPHLVFQEIRK